MTIIWPSLTRSPRCWRGWKRWRAVPIGRGGLAVLRVADLELDTQARQATRGGQAVRLQHREFLLLEQLVRHSGQVVTRTMLLEAAWNYDFDPRGNIIDMHVHRLRQKIDQGFAFPLIHTVLGAGYMLREPADADGTVEPPASAQIRSHDAIHKTDFMRARSGGHPGSSTVAMALAIGAT